MVVVVVVVAAAAAVAVVVHLYILFCRLSFLSLLFIGSAEIVLATEINSHFFTERSTDQRLEYIPNAGIRLLSVRAEDSGTYSVHVNLNLHGSIMSHVQSVNVVVTGKNLMILVISVILVISFFR